jgi:hypothetical protein
MDRGRRPSSEAQVRFAPRPLAQIAVDTTSLQMEAPLSFGV